MVIIIFYSILTSVSNSLFLFLRPKFGYLLRNLPANVFYKLLEGKIVENKKTKFSHAKQIFFTFFRNTNEYEY